MEKFCSADKSIAGAGYRAALRNLLVDIVANKTDQSKTAAFEQQFCQRIARISKNKPLPTAARTRILQKLEELKKDLAQRGKHA